MTSARPSIVLAEVAVIVMALIWGVNYSVIKYGTSMVTPVAYNGVRVALATLALVVIALVWGGVPPARRDVIGLMALGVLGNGVYQLFFAEGISRTRAGEAALVVGASPALIALFGRLRGVEQITRRGAIGIALSMFGVGLVVLGAATGGTAEGGSLFGDLLVLCGTICWALYTVYLIPYTTRINGFYVIAISMIGGSIVLLAVGARAIAAQDWSGLPTSVWVALVYSGLGGLVVAYILWYRGVKVLGPTRTALYANLQPLIALVVAWFTLHETPTAWQLLGAGTIVSGVLLARTGNRAIVKLVLFDIDGTLLLSDGAGRRAIHRALREVFGSVGPADYRFDGKTDPQIVRELMRMAGHGDERIDADMQRLLSRYAECLHEELAAPGHDPKPLPGVTQLLDALEQRSDVILGLLTGNIEPGARAKLDAVGLDPRRFRVGAFGSDHELRPELPAIAQERTRAQLGVHVLGPAMIVIGDTPADLTCGRSLGALAIGVATGRYSVEELEQHAPAAVFADLTDTDRVVRVIVGA